MATASKCCCCCCCSCCNVLVNTCMSVATAAHTGGAAFPWLYMALIDWKLTCAKHFHFIIFTLLTVIDVADASFHSLIDTRKPIALLYGMNTVLNINSDLFRHFIKIKNGACNLIGLFLLKIRLIERNHRKNIEQVLSLSTSNSTISTKCSPDR